MNKVKNDERFIKKKYGENMWKLCSRLFPRPLERAELLASILDYYFDHGRGLYDYIEDNNLEFEFQSFVLQKLYPREYQVKLDKPDKTPKELLKEAGYKLYKCETEDDIQKFRKYYTDREALCTFKDGRLETSYVYFAVKENADKIKREDFTDPKREDEYGTSVLSIQFSKGPSHALSIINRYNHSVDRPNATFGNNLDNIIPGLTASFAHYEGMVQSKIETFEDHMMRGYVQDSKKKFHKIIALVDGYAFCENNFIVDMNTHAIDKTYVNKERYIFMDGYILDQKEKKFINYVDKAYYKAFSDANGIIERINVHKESKEKKTIIIESKLFFPITIKLDNGKIIYYKNDNIKELGKKFMSSSRYLKEVDLPNVKKIGDGVFENSFKLKTLYIPNCKEIGDYFLVNGYDALNINLNSVEKIGTDFLSYNKNLYKLSLPNVKEIEDGFLEYNEFLEIFEADKLEKMGHSCFQHNIELHKLNLPSLKEMDNYSFNCNLGIETLSLPSLVKMGDNCFEENKSIDFVDLNNIEKIGNNCFKKNTELEDFFGPNVVKIGDNFLDRNKILHLFYAPKLKSVGDYFLGSNNGLKELSLNNLEKVGKGFLLSNKVLTRLRIPKFKFNNNEELIDDLFLASHIGNIDMLVPLSTKYKYKLMKKINMESYLYGFDSKEKVKHNGK